MTRIAYVCADPGVPVFGCKGCSIHAQEVMRALLRGGAEIELFAANPGGSPSGDLARVRVHALPAPMGIDGDAREQALLAMNDDLRRALNSTPRLDAVYERYALWSHAALEWAAERGIPGLLEVNAPLIEEQARYRRLNDRPAAENATRRVLAAASRILAVSREVAAHFADFPEAEGRILVVPNGVDANRFAPGIAREIPKVSESVTIGFVGTLKPWHGVESLIEACSGSPGCRLLIVGDGPERARLESLARERGLEGGVTFTGAVAPERVPALLASMDIAAAPYPDLPGFYFSPLKLFEYMASGLAIVASSVGQITETLVHGETGLLYPPGDTGALASLLRTLCNDADLRRRLGANARTTAVRYHSWDAVASRILLMVRTSRGAPVAEAC